MNAVRDAINDLLRSDAALEALVEDRIFYQEAPTGTVFPYVIFQRQSGGRDYTFSGNPMAPQIWLVKAVDRDKLPGPAEAIDAAIEQVLDRATLVVPGHQTLGQVLRDTDVAYPEGQGTETFQHVGGTYRLTTQRN